MALPAMQCVSRFVGRAASGRAKDHRTTSTSGPLATVHPRERSRVVRKTRPAWNRVWTLYAIVDQNGAVRYVGCTYEPLAGRLKQHRRSKAPVGQWLRRYENGNTKAAIVPICRIEPVSGLLIDSFLRRAIEQLAINNFLKDGADLLNVRPVIGAGILEKISSFPGCLSTPVPPRQVLLRGDTRRPVGSRPNGTGRRSLICDQARRGRVRCGVVG